MKKIRFDIFVLAIFVFYICEHVIHSLSPPTAFLWGWPQWFTLTVIVYTSLTALFEVYTNLALGFDFISNLLVLEFKDTEKVLFGTV